MNLENYYNPKNLPLKYKAAIFSSRACPLACNFCDMFLVMGKKHRKRSVKTIVDEIEFLNKDLGVNYFSFMDDQLTLNRAHTIELCDEIIRRGLHKEVELAIQTRADNFVLQGGEEVVKKMRAAGFSHASFGMETGVQRLADLTLKDETIEIHLEAIRLCQKYDMKVSLGMIFGLPTETSRDRKTGFELIRSLPVTFTKFNSLIPYPGTPLYTDLIDSGRVIVEKDWANFNSTLIFTTSIFDPTPLPYVPETSSEWQLRREIISYNLRSFLNFGTLMNILDHTRGMAWISLPKWWFVKPKEIKTNKIKIVKIKRILFFTKLDLHNKS